MAEHRATVIVVAAWLLTAAVFSSSQGFVQVSGLRSGSFPGHESSVAGHELKFQPFDEGHSTAKASHWASVASVAVAFGLVFGMMSIPALADEAPAPASEASAPAPVEQSMPKKKKLALRKEQERERRAVVKPKKSSEASVSLFGASSSAPSSANAAAMKTSAGRIYYNASD
eukprot:CAMPEP_0170594658 /NCGR_PEP_ID=MMETSP0224-20130122/14122_1 /TAXON_ID=285029 /ORGANISM="Togula jolla, Strain CCCM 725" /LENGTH=171 /DNA_ID=CAMNT_0010918739 /DNA_START=70 /DNA_END=582 /DNA_ORIENTATION=-